MHGAGIGYVILLLGLSIIRLRNKLNIMDRSCSTGSIQLLVVFT